MDKLKKHVLERYQELLDSGIDPERAYFQAVSEYLFNQLKKKPTG